LSLADNPNTWKRSVLGLGTLATNQLPMAYDIREVERI
jgi:hypothetical protein